MQRLKTNNWAHFLDNIVGLFVFKVLKRCTKQTLMGMCVPAELVSRLPVVMD